MNTSSDFTLALVAFMFGFLVIGPAVKSCTDDSPPPDAIEHRLDAEVAE